MDTRDHVCRWLETVVIGLELCPFARSQWVNGRVRVSVSAAETEDALLADLQAEMALLTDDESIETTLLVHPRVLTDFADFNQFLDMADLLIRELDLEGVYQVASFHPDYRFAGTEPGDVENCTNRSPYPMLHLLREESLEHAIARYPDPEGIPRRNIERLREIGMVDMQTLLRTCTDPD